MAKLDIQIVSEPGERGRKAIMVAGEQWGRARMESRGPHGVSYYFENMAGDVLGTNEKQNRGVAKFRAFNVVGDKIAKRRTRGGEPEPAPLDERIYAAVTEWIEKKILRSPEDVRAAAERERKRYRESVAETEQKEKAEFETKAKEAILSFNCYVLLNGAKEPHPKDVAAVVAAMRWAQTK